MRVVLSIAPIRIFFLVLILAAVSIVSVAQVSIAVSFGPPALPIYE